MRWYSGPYGDRHAFDLLCRIHRNRNRNKSKYLTDLLGFCLKQHASFYQKNLNIYEETCLTIVWQECIRSLTLFRTNRNHEFCLRSWILERGILERGSGLEFQCQVLLTSRTYIWILNETKDAICGFVPRLDFQTKQDLMYGVPPKKERPKFYYFWET